MPLFYTFEPSAEDVTLVSHNPRIFSWVSIPSVSASVTYLIILSRTKQQAVEAMDFAARGKVKVNMKIRPLSEVNE